MPAQNKSGEKVPTPDSAIAASARNTRGLLAPRAQGVQAGLHTPDNKWSLAKIRVTMVYFVPKGRVPLADWHSRLTYYARRLEAFHAREFGNASRLTVEIRPEPYLSPKMPEEFRTGDQNAVFWQTMGDARKALNWPANRANGFPILLAMSDINWRELDDFTRTRMVNGVPQHEGYVNSEGRHFPGAESGGARAVYLADEGVGMGLVSADGWRVSYSGSDCVVYHEGVGHSIGLPHPEPMNDSVMGTAQYRFWLNQTWVDAGQKRSLGAEAPAGVSQTSQASANLFSAFTALPNPLVPHTREPVFLRLTWPAGAKVRSLAVETQTALRGAWKPVRIAILPSGGAPEKVSLGKFAAPTPVSYLVRATLKNGETTELRGYFQVK